MCNGGLCHLHCGPLHNFACYAIHTFTHPRHSRLIDILQILEQGEWNNGQKLRSRPSIYASPSSESKAPSLFLCFILKCTVQMTWPGLTLSRVTRLDWVTGDIPLMTQQNNIWPSITTSHHNTIHRADHTGRLTPAWCGVNISELWKIWSLRLMDNAGLASSSTHTAIHSWSPC